MRTRASERSRFQPLSLLPVLGALLVACGGASDAPTTSSPSAGSGGQSPVSGGGTGASTANGGLGGAVGSAGSAQAGNAGTTPSGSAGSSSGGVNAGGSAGSGTAGSAGSSGSAGSGAGDFPDPATFVCNAVIGVSVTGDWYNAGFETGLSGDKWQLQWQSLAFVEQWADSANAVWQAPITSACASGSSNPDRVIFTGVNWTFTTEAEWETQLTKAVETFKTKFPAVREIDLMTMLRAPNNQVCGDPSVSATNEQVVQPFIDQALSAVGAKYPKLVRVLQKFYAPSCAVFQTNSPHFADGQAAVVAKVYRDYFSAH